MGDIDLNYADVRVMITALEGRPQRDAKDLERAHRLANNLRRYELTVTEHRAVQSTIAARETYAPEEVSNEQETQHQAPEEPVVVQGEGAAVRPEPSVRSDPVGRATGLGQAMKGLIPGLSQGGPTRDIYGDRI